MNSNIPAIERYMTPSPHTIGRDQPLLVAHRMMEQHSIRHLPVLEAGHLLGVLSERDLRLIESLPGVDPATFKVEDAMSQTPFHVTPDVPLATVVSEMAAHKYGCAVVVRYGRVVGIFTTTDALEVLWSLLRKNRDRHPELYEPCISSPGDASVVGR
jgi:acetoin utilization protein AcuB